MGEILKVFKKNKILAAVILIALSIMLALALSSDGESTEGGEITLAEYKLKVEGELAELCSSVDGVGKCYVYVTFEKGSESTYKSGNLIETRPPKIMGVSVVCRGAENARVKSELTELFTSIFGIGANRVKILKLK